VYKNLLLSRECLVSSEDS